MLFRSMALGASIPAFTYSVAGFLNSDTSSVIGGSATETTIATSSSAPGVYPISFSSEALTAANYTFSYFNGSLSIVQAPTVVISATSTLSGSHTGGYTLTITLTNIGTGAASNVVLSTATLGSVSGTPLPQSVPSIAAGGSAIFTVKIGRAHV